MDNNRFVTNSCHIYILTDGCNTKIGITTNLNKRIATYRTHNPNFRLFKTFETNHDEAKKVEAVLLVFLERETNNKYQRSLHEIPLNEEAYYLRDIISQIGISTTTRFVIPANIEAAQDRLRQLFAEEANLGKPFNLIPDDVM